MKTLAFLETIADKFNSKEQLQKELTLFEGGHLWNMLTSRYDVVELTQIFHNIARDPDLKVILSIGLETLREENSKLENFLKQYGVPLPERPPAASEIPLKLEVMTDRIIFRTIFGGIQSFIPTYAVSFIHAPSPKLREFFLEMLISEAKIYDKFILYGQFKGWLEEPPTYRV